MSKVTRYDLNEDVATGTPEISPVPDSFEGPFVSYEDYAALEARVKELEALTEELRTDSHEAAKVAGTNAARAQKAEAELARRDAQEPIYQLMDDGKWYDTERYLYDEAKERGDVARLVYTGARQAVLPGKDTIREVFMRNGFTIKEGQTDLKDYVYAAASDLLALGCPQQRFIVKMKPSYALREEYPTLALHDLITAIRAAGGEIAE